MLSPHRLSFQSSLITGDVGARPGEVHGACGSRVEGKLSACVAAVRAVLRHDPVALGIKAAPSSHAVLHYQADVEVGGACP